MIKVRFLSRRDASNYLHKTRGIKRAPKTLAKLASIGGGPAFRKDGIRVLYDPADLDAWAESILSPLVSSTAELAALKQRTVHGSPENIAAPALRRCAALKK